MDDKSRSLKKGTPQQTENLCSYCLFFQPDPQAATPLRGNCTYHKEWIQNASRTTCSDMSNYPLKEKGIYKLVSDQANGWLHVRRRERIRTRLFLIKGSTRPKV